MAQSIEIKFQADFMQGWSFACIEIMLANQASHFETKIVTLIILLCLKFGTMRSEIFIGEILLKNILYETLLIYIFYRFERRQRNLFQSLHETQKELAQLKDVLQKLVSPCISIIDWSGEESLFQNKAFDMLLESFENNIPNPLLAFQKSFELNDDITLNDFLRGVQTRNFSDTGACFLSGSCKVEGQLHFFDLTINPIIWDKVPSLLIALEDVTHKKELSHLKLAQEDKDLLIATVSHELRTPLHGVLGLIQIVEPKIKEKETLDYLSLCKDNANLLLNLVNSLLDNQQIQHGKIKLLPSKVHIEGLIKNVLALFSFQANQKNVKLFASIEDDVPSHIITDENRLKQVLINLVSNALKFTFSGTIKINIHQQSQDHLKFSVSDTGRGINKDDFDKIFKIYTKLEDKEGFNKQGVGLGLTISNNIVKLLADQQYGVTVESQYGSGSTFSFSIHQDLNQVLFLQETLPKSLPKKVLLTTQSTCNDIRDFEEYSQPVDLKSKLSHYISPLNPSISKNPSDLFKISSKTLRTKDFLTEKISHSLLGFSHFPSKNPSKGLILVVDDVYMNILIAKNFFENSGYQVQTASSGQEAIEKFREFRKIGLAFTCVFMDCQMPIMDGFETTKILKKMMATDKIKSVPIVALTASQDKKTVQKCYESGMVEHLCKPLIKEDIFRVLSQFESQK